MDMNARKTVNKSKIKKCSRNITNRKCIKLDAEKKVEILKKLDHGISKISAKKLS